MKIYPVPFGFSDPYGDEWQIDNIGTENSYVKKRIDESILISPLEIKGITSPLMFIIEGKVDIIGYMPDGKAIWFFPQ